MTGDRGDSSLTGRPGTPLPRFERAAWAVVAIACLLVRLPVMYCQPGGQDEDCYAIPGLTILKTGLPQLPHVPSRDGDSVYYQADRLLIAEPPLSFYWQSLFYALLPAQYGTARLASLVAGGGLLGAVWRLARRGGATERSCWIAVTGLSLSRWFYFAATTARPDILCAAFGVIATLLVVRWQMSLRGRDLLWAGVLIGLGGLTHPFSLAYAVPLGLWVAVGTRGRQRWLATASMTATAMATACLWLPFLLWDPELTRVQFYNQYLADVGPGLAVRLVQPVESLRYHAVFAWEQIGPVQCVLAGLGLILMSLAGGLTGHRLLQGISATTWLTGYLICVIVGPHHHVWGYWSFPAALIVAGSAITGTMLASRPVVTIGLRLAVVAAMLLLVPGSGLRAVLTYLRHAGDPDYCAPMFARGLIGRIPADAVVAVDPQYVLDFYAAGRPTLLLQTLPHYFQVQQESVDWLVVGRPGIEERVIERVPGELVWTTGRAEDRFACYAEGYRAAPKAKTTR